MKIAGFFAAVFAAVIGGSVFVGCSAHADGYSNTAYMEYNYTDGFDSKPNVEGYTAEWFHVLCPNLVVVAKTSWSQSQYNGKKAGSTAEVVAIQVIPSIAIADNIKGYVTIEGGDRYSNQDAFVYGSLEPGVKVTVSPTWAIQTGVRYRDDIQNSIPYQTWTVRDTLLWTANERSTWGLRHDYIFGASNQGHGINLTYGYKF